MFHSRRDGGFTHLARDKTGEEGLDQAGVVQEPAERHGRDGAYPRKCAGCGKSFSGYMRKDRQELRSQHCHYKEEDKERKVNDRRIDEHLSEAFPF